MLGNVHRIAGARGAIAQLVLLAVVITASPAFGGALYQACPTGCCSPYGEEAGCDRAEPVAPKSLDCSCQSTCDSACSECEHFHAGVIQPPQTSLPVQPRRFSLDPPVSRLIGHPSYFYRPPPVVCA